MPERYRVHVRVLDTSAALIRFVWFFVGGVPRHPALATPLGWSFTFVKDFRNLPFYRVTNKGGENYRCFAENRRVPKLPSIRARFKFSVNFSWIFRTSEKLKSWQWTVKKISPTERSPNWSSMYLVAVWNHTATKYILRQTVALYITVWQQVISLLSMHQAFK